MTAGPLLRLRLCGRALLLQAAFSDERRQALGFAWAIDPALVRAYAGNAAGLNAARARHLAPFNVQPCAAGLPLGVAAALEARAAKGDAAAAARAVALKASLGAALSGAADAFFWGALRPLAAAAAILAALIAWRLGARRPFACGAALGLLIFNVPGLWARWAGVSRGLDADEGAALDAARLPVQEWICFARRAAVLAIFAAAWYALGLPFGAFGIPRLLAACAFAAGAGSGRFTGGPMRLIAAAGLLGAAASAAGWTGSVGAVTERVFTVKNRLGLHARPAALFAQEAARHKCAIVVVKDGLEVSGKSVMGLMLLAAESGSKLTVKADGVDEDKALDALGLIFERKFDEQ